MRILIDNTLPEFNYSDLKDSLEKFGIKAELLLCKINFNFIEVNVLSEWAKGLGEKILIITDCEITNKRVLNFSVDLKGVVDDINGWVGVISYTKVDKNFSLICAHEALHLLGLTHCHNENCIMSIKFKDRKFIYPVYFNNKEELILCKDCQGVLDGRKN